MARRTSGRWMASTVSLLGLVAASLVGQTEARAVRPDSARIIDHWTPERRAQAIPRDLVIDERGYGYLKHADGTLEPYGHSVAPKTPLGKPVVGGDTAGPVITAMDPTANASIGTTYTFAATVTDSSGIKSVTFYLVNPSSVAQSATPTGAGGVYSKSLSGLTPGSWSWYVVAKDNSGRANTTTSATINFTVGGTPPPDLGVVANAQWAAGGAVQTAAGRIYFYMPTSKRLTRWAGYVCSGTVITDTATDRSIIVTAAHCVYDDVNKAFAKDVMFIPNQAGTTAPGTDRTCSNDPIGCWTPSFAVVDVDWTTRTFPANEQWDYAYYVVNAAGSHISGINGAVDLLEAAAGNLPISFGSPIADDLVNNGPTAPDYTFALGYSYAMDPHFMYCAEDMTKEGLVNWWLPNCGLTGGSSGGPWIQPMDVTTGSGQIISVNSWGYTSQPGMAGPQLDRNTAAQVLAIASCASFTVAGAGPGKAGIAVTATTSCQ